MSRDLLAEPLWSEKQCAERANLTISYLRAKRSRGGGPPFVRIGRMVRYYPQDVRDWLASHGVVGKPGEE